MGNVSKKNPNRNYRRKATIREREREREVTINEPTTTQISLSSARKHCNRQLREGRKAESEMREGRREIKKTLREKS